MIANSEWKGICSRMSQGLQEVKKEWFKSCLNAVRDAEKQGNSSRIVNDDLAGNISQAMNAFQLLQVSHILAEKEYILPENGRDFMTLLYDYVCKNEVDKCLEYFGRYCETEDLGQQLFRISADITQGITNEKDPVITMSITSFVPVWGIFSKMIVSETFNDKDTARQLTEQREQYMKKMSEDTEEDNNQRINN